MATIYTRGGDDGTTSLAGGDRIAKDAPAIELLGA
ncbi:MAG: ATP:cob(I)alamin adenosyltransferase, partial [Coriobacteriia bacterium]|nr:ATP:cob(I)alamin adenosyltransferase [Coriobacteriia bacterium]